MKKIIFLFIIVVYTFGCGSSQKSYSAPKKSNKPAWITNVNSVYSPSKYISAVGEGDTRKQAMQDAAGNISNMFEAKISVDRTTQERYRELTKMNKTSVEQSTDINTNINIQSATSIKNIQYGESYTDNMGRTYIVAYLDKFKTGNIYVADIEANAKTISSFIENAKKQSKFRKYSYLNAALIYAKANQTEIEKLQIIAPHEIDLLELNYDLNNLIEMTNQAAQELTFDIKIEGESADKIENTIAEALTQKGFTVNNQGEFKFNGIVTLEKIDLKRKEEFVRWEINLTLKDAKENTVFSFNQKNREGHINLSEAKARAIRTMQRVIKKKLVDNLNKYADGLLS